MVTTGALVVALGLAASTGVAAGKDISNERYAKRICVDLERVETDRGGLDELDPSDPATYQAEAVAAVDRIVAATKATRAKLKKVSPDDGGKQVTKLFDRYLKQYTAGVEAAASDFAAADPASPDFSGEVTVFTVAIDNVPIEVDDPFPKLTDHQDLLAAFGDVTACRGIVEVTGG